MKISKKRTVQVMVFAIALLLVLALSIGITGAWYQAKRQASGTVIMNQGIIIDYKGFAEDADATTWGKGVTLNLFAITDAQPGQNIAVNASSIRANVDSVDFYARVKLDYKFYNVVKSTQEGVADTKTEVKLDDASKLITTSENFFGSNWVKSQNNDGWFYYGAGTTLGQFTQSTDFVALFANDAKFVIEGANFVGAENNGEGGGFVVNNTSINQIEVTLTLETLQGSADSDSEHWYIVEPPVVEDFSSNQLKDASGTVLTPSETTLAESTTYQVVDASNAGYKFIITNSATGQAQTLASVDVSVVNGEATITGYTGSPTELTIPDYITVNGEVYKVTSIGQYAFSNCNSLISVKISNRVTSIGIGAFYKCSSLHEFSIDTETPIIRINNLTFQDCNNLTSITIPNSVTSIGAYAFANAGLTAIIIPDSVSNIENSVFMGCNISSIYLPASISTISSGTFSKCNNLTSIIVDSNNTKYKSSGNCIIEKTTGKLIQGCNTSIIPTDSSVKSIDSAFVGFSSITYVKIPDNIMNVSSGSFNNCINLNTINIGSGISEVSWLPTTVTKVTISENNEKLASDTEGKAIFAKKEANVLELSKFISGDSTYILPSKLILNNDEWNITSIGSKAFYNCLSLISIKISEGIINIGSQAFYKCKNLTSITIPKGVENIGGLAFYNCSSLESIIIPDSIISMGSQIFQECYSLISVTIGNGITTIPSNCFNNCTTLKTVVIKGTITEIKSEAFSSCWSLTTILINSEVDATTLGLVSARDTLYTEQGEVFTGEPVEGTIYYYKYTRS